MNCVFCKIASGEIPSSKVYEDSSCIAFFEINPASDGHVVVTTKNHYEDLNSIPTQEFLNAWSIVRFVSQVLQEELNPKGYNILLNTGEVKNQQSKHVSIHLIPLKGGEEVFMGWKPKKLDEKLVKKLSERAQIKLNEQIEETKKQFKEHQKEIIKVVKTPKRLNP